MRNKRSAALVLLALVGLALTCAGLAGTWRVPDLLQYAAPAPETSEGLMNLVEDRKTALSDMADAVEASAVLAIKSGTYVSAGEGGASAQATLLAGSEGMFAVSPRYLTEGRLITDTELKAGEKVAVLDEELAFALFPTTGAVEGKVSVGGVELRVVGVVRHNRKVGERDLYNVYAPVRAVPAAGYEAVVLTVKPVPGSGAEIMFPSTAEAGWYSGGVSLSLEKESMRAHMPLRVSLSLAAIALIALGLRLWNRFSARRIRDIRAKLEKEYLPRVLPRILLYGLAIALGYGAIAACMYLTASFTAAPLYVFTEWVPENLVKWSAIRDVFWNLAGSDARLVQASTPEAREIAFWGGVLRWGVFFLYAAGLLAVLRRLVREKLDR